MAINIQLLVRGTKFKFRLIVHSLFSVILISCGTLHPGIYEPDTNDYQLALEQGWEYLNQRQHSHALAEFTEAEILRPSQSEPIYGRAKALFYMERFDEVLGICSEFSGKAEDHFNVLEFCWGSRLEINRATPAIRKEVRNEIEKILGSPDPSVELLYSAYKGYYYLKDKEKRFSLILRAAEKETDSSLAEGIAASLFEEMISAESASEQRISLAESYVRNFPKGRMADKAASILLQNLLEKQADKPDDWQIAQTILNGRETSPLINGAVAFWLIEQGTNYDHVIRLLRKNLLYLDDKLQDVPANFSEALWQQEIDKKRLFYKYLLGRTWLAKGELKKAEENLEVVIAKQKGWADPYHFRGMLALKEGRADQAIKYFRTALARGTVRPETSKQLRVLLEKRYGFTGEPLAYFQAQHGGPRFSDVTEMVGLAGVKAERVAWGDYDNDDDDDLLLDGTKLFNNQSGKGFIAASQIRPIDSGGENGGIWGDYDNDRFLDIFVTSRRSNYLLRNESGVRFTKTDILPPGGLVEKTEAVAWGDVNNDGYLDLYVANYEHGVVLRGQCGQDQLLVNQGGIDFKESGTVAGIISEEAMCGRGVVWSDLNGDGWQDIMVSNYRLDPNFLWLNQGNDSFIDGAASAGVQGNEVNGAYGHSIGSVSGDLDGDEDFDLYTSNLAHPRYIEFSDRSMVLSNNGDQISVFDDLFPESGIFFDETSSDPQFFDVDNDGDLDLYVTSIYQNRSSHLYINDGAGRFNDLTWLAGAGVRNGWGAASADYDGDGYLDLLVASRDGVRLLRNEGGSYNWLAVRIDDRNCNRYGVGSKVIIDYGGQRQVREITAGRGTGSQDSLTVHFGLGGYSGSVSIRVKTLCGDILQQQVKDLNRIVIITSDQKG